ncbi:hypothetical protein [Nocardiopsis oceani]
MDEPATAEPTLGHALHQAARILEWAEGETDLAKAKLFGDLADSWLGMASILAERAEP